jgi:phospholipase C
MSTDRRTFLQLLSTGAFAAAYEGTIRKALAIPAHHRTGTIADVEHIVILMQENRSFDHYYGTLKGVRGFGDPRAVKLPSGAPVWQQPDGTGYVMPYHPTAPDFGMAYLVDTAHSWPDTQAAWNGGKYDQWIPNKSQQTMAYYTRKDIPFHFALADAFTICDAYHCSFLGATDPNRYHMWTGWVGNDGQNGGPVLDNSEAGYDWSTYPERLSRNGVSWKIYQDAGAGLDAAHFWGWGDDAYIGNYGDNSLLYFHQYQNAAPGSALYQGARQATDISHQSGTTLFDQFRADVMNNKLPQVSWIVAPEAYTEHGNWPANFGAWYVSQMLEALTDNPEVWSKTAFFLMFDENDGFFDHMVPPTPPRNRADGLSNVDTTNEIFAGDSRYESGPYGFGVRVPMTVISPWSKGGWVCSELFDHTSLIQFIEQRFAHRNRDLIEKNITTWRRAVAGDLTSAFNFKNPNASVPSLPSTAAYVPPDSIRHDDYIPPVPAVQSLPKQEPGVRPARAVPYELHVLGEADFGEGEVRMHLGNSGKAAAVFQVRSANDANGPWTYTVAPDSHVNETWGIRADGQTAYDLSVYGPNGFFRSFKGSISGRDKANLTVRASYDRGGCGVTLEIKNVGDTHAKVKIADGYSRQRASEALHPGETTKKRFSLSDSFGWYDLTITVESDAGFKQEIAGHVETGDDSVTDPLLGLG